MNADCYRLTTPTVGLVEEDGHRVAHLVPKGSIIAVRSASFDETALVDVLWAERVVLMFAQDLRARAEPMNGRPKVQGGLRVVSDNRFGHPVRREHGVILYPCVPKNVA